jgi:hypothetical protein
MSAAACSDGRWARSSPAVCRARGVCSTVYAGPHRSRLALARRLRVDGTSAGTYHFARHAARAAARGGVGEQPAASATRGALQRRISPRKVQGAEQSNGSSTLSATDLPLLGRPPFPEPSPGANSGTHVNWDSDAVPASARTFHPRRRQNRRSPFPGHPRGIRGTPAIPTATPARLERPRDGSPCARNERVAGPARWTASWSCRCPAATVAHDGAQVAGASPTRPDSRTLRESG